ncbi:MAG TPA: hypothetical protein PKK26_05155 [Candidatus Wallbacteria bacterium]|nr:hypothetical protein [Candidatus Wallbacteria bacterium]
MVKKNPESCHIGVLLFKTLFFILAISGLGMAGFIMGGNISPKQDLSSAFYIVSIKPENNSEIFCGDTVAVKFSSAVKKQTIISNNVFAFDLKKEKLINIGYTYNDALQTLFIKIPESVCSDIQIEFTDQIASGNGLLLTGGKKIFYTVKAHPVPAPARKQRSKKNSKITLRPNSIQKNML